MPNALSGHPPWRQLLIISVAVPLVAVLAVLVFAWPAGRIAPRNLPLGVVGSGSSSQAAVAGLTKAKPGGFDLHTYADVAAAREAIRHREVYGALDVTPAAVTVLTADAAGPVVSQLLTATGQGLAASLGAGAAAAVPVRTVDVVATSSGDPRGTVLSSTLLPLSICGMLVAAVIAVLLGMRPAWRQVAALLVVSAAVGIGVWLIAQGFLGALPHGAFATWAALSLLVLAVSSTTAGLVALVGAKGLAVAGAVMVFVGNAFAGVTSAPELLPTAAGDLGQWLPPGAGASLVRSTAYFGGAGAGPHVAVLVAWSAGGLAAVVLGHHSFAGFAARTGGRGAPASSGTDEALPDRHSAGSGVELKPID